MKKFAILILLLNSSWAIAENNVDCNDLAKGAKLIMEVRQQDVPMAEIWAKSKDKSNYKLIQSMLIRAYEEPAYQTKQHQQRAITEFANLYFMACVN